MAEAARLTVRERLRADLRRYYEYQEDPNSVLQRLKTILLTEAVWSIIVYRFGQYLREEAPRALALVGRVPYEFAFRILRMLIGIHLSPDTVIGPGLYIGHFGGIWISPYARVGANCNIAHEVTIGLAGPGRIGPVLGDRVWVGPNATISGPVRVGSGAVIGANSLVVSHIPENAVAIGVPTRIISYAGSGKLIRIPADTWRGAQ